MPLLVSLSLRSSPIMTLIKNFNKKMKEIFSFCLMLYKSFRLWYFLKNSSFDEVNYYLGIEIIMIYLLIIVKLRSPFIILVETSSAKYFYIIILTFIGYIILKRISFSHPFDSLHYSFFSRSSFYSNFCNFLFDFSPTSVKTRLIAIFFFNILPLSFLNIVIFKQLCLGFFNLQFLLLLLPIQFFTYWIYIYKFYFSFLYSELLPLYNKIVTFSDTVPLYTFIYEYKEEVFLEALQSAYEIEDFKPLFKGFTPEQYIEACYLIGGQFYYGIGFGNLLAMINRYGFLELIFLSLLIIILSLDSIYPFFILSFCFSFSHYFGEIYML